MPNSAGQQDSHLVFVYGSLRKGHWNNYLVEESDFVGEACTVDHDFNMVSLGHFPAVLKDGDNAIYGELYTVDQQTFDRLDMLEGNGRMYLREEFDFVDMHGNEHVAWMYCFLSDPSDDGDLLFQNIDVFESQCGFDIQSWAKEERPRSW